MPLAGLRLGRHLADRLAETAQRDRGRWCRPGLRDRRPGRVDRKLRPARWRRRSTPAGSAPRRAGIQRTRTARL